MGVEVPSAPSREMDVRRDRRSWNDVGLSRETPGRLGARRHTEVHTLACPPRHTTIDFGTSGQPNEHKNEMEDMPGSKGRTLTTESMGTLSTKARGHDKRRPKTTQTASRDSTRLDVCKPYHTCPTKKNSGLNKLIYKLVDMHVGYEAKNSYKTRRDGLGRSYSVPVTALKCRSTLETGKMQQSKYDSYVNKRNSLFVGRKTSIGSNGETLKTQRNISHRRCSRSITFASELTEKDARLKNPPAHRRVCISKSSC